MPLTPAEKQRRYRERRDADPWRQRENREKDRQRWHKNKVLVAGMTDRQHRREKKWAVEKRKQRQKMKLGDSVAELSPPATPTPCGSRSVLSDCDGEFRS